MANSVVRVGTKTLISSTLQSSIYGTNFGEALTDNLIRNSAYAVGTEAAHTIGDWNEAYNLNDFEHLALHGMLGCAIGAISDNCGNGALGAVLGEFTAEKTGNANFGRVAGAIGVALTGGDAEGIYVGYDTADNAITNNYLMPHEAARVKVLLAEQDSCTGTRCTEITAELEEYHNLDDSRNAELASYYDSCAQGVQTACNKVREINSIPWIDFDPFSTIKSRPDVLKESDNHPVLADNLSGKVLNEFLGYPATLTNDILGGWLYGQNAVGEGYYVNPLTGEILSDAEYQGLKEAWGVNVGTGIAGNWILGAANPSTSTTFLYRAVSPQELLDIENKGVFRNLGSAEGKYFTTSSQAAASYARQAVKGFNDAPYTIIHTEAPNAIFKGLAPAKVDRGIPAWVIPDDRLNLLTPKVLNSSPIP